jgi:hypothetical protein
MRDEGIPEQVKPGLPTALAIMIHRGTEKFLFIGYVYSLNFPDGHINRDLEIGEEIFLADAIRIIKIYFSVEPVRDKLPLFGISPDPAPRFVEFRIGALMYK